MVPFPDKAQAIQVIAVPTNKKQFIGVIDYKEIHGIRYFGLTSKYAKWTGYKK